jgi:hypothetical protein
VSTVFRQTSIAQDWSTPRTVNDRSQAEEDGNAQREVEDLLVGEQRAQSPEERVTDRRMVVGEPLGILDRETLPRRVARVGGVFGDILVELWRDAGIEDRWRAKVRARDAVVDLGDAHPGQLALFRGQDAFLMRAADHPRDHRAQLRPQCPDHGGLATGTVWHVEPSHEPSSSRRGPIPL